MPRPIRHTFTMDAADADGICAAQAVAGAGNLTIAGDLATAGVATMDVARHLVAVSAGAGDTTQTLTITGTDRYGNALTGTIALNGTTPVPLASNFLTVTQVAADAACAGNISVGSDDAADTKWLPVDARQEDYPFSIAVQLSSGASMTFKEQHTYDNVLAVGFVEGDAQTTDHASMTGKSADFASTHASPVTATRIRVSGFSSGSLTYTVIQGG